MAHVDIKLNQLLRVYIDGIPLNLASTLLPWKTKFSPTLFMHIHLHAKYQKKHSSNSSNVSTKKALGIKSLLGMVDNLEYCLKKFKWKPKGTEWVDYYTENEHASDFLENKNKVVKNYLTKLTPKIVWDLGSNIGIFSRITSSKEILLFPLISIQPASKKIIMRLSRKKIHTYSPCYSI